MKTKLEEMLKEIETEPLQNGMSKKEEEFLIKLKCFGETNFEEYVKYYNRYMAIKNYKKVRQKQQ